MMKTISTQYRDDEPCDFNGLIQLLSHLEDEEFLTLVDDNQQNFIQMAFDEDENFVYIIEIRIYQNAEDFTHYRIFCDEFEQVLGYFERFYHDQLDFDLTTWQNVTDKFLNTLTVDTRLAGECYDGYIATLESVMYDVGLFADMAEAGDFVHIFTDDLANRQSLIIYPNFDTPTMRYDVIVKNSMNETPVKTYERLQDIETLVQDFLE